MKFIFSPWRENSVAPAQMQIEKQNSVNFRYNIHSFFMRTIFYKNVEEKKMYGLK